MPIPNIQSEIVVGVNGSPCSTAAVEWAARDAQLRGTALRLVNVLAPPSLTGSSPWAGVPVRSDQLRSRLDKTGARKILEVARKTAEAVAAGGDSPINTGLLFGSVVPTLADYTQHADMLVVGCRGRPALARALFGSVSTGLVHHASCPLAVVHDDDALATRSTRAPVLVGIDGSPASGSALNIAFDEASRRGVDLVALHTWNDDGPVGFGRPGHAPIDWANLQTEEEEILSEQLAGWASRYPDVSIHKVVVADRPVHRLLELAEEAQLMVVGSHGRGGFASALRGSVCSTVATTAHIPVIVTHSPREAA